MSLLSTEIRTTDQLTNVALATKLISFSHKHYMVTVVERDKNQLIFSDNKGFDG